MARKLATVHGLGEDDLIISRNQLEDLQGNLYALQAALQDVEGDLDHARSAGDQPDYREAYEWLVAAARPLSSMWIEPRGT
jgi:hypothetical protein